MRINKDAFYDGMPNHKGYKKLMADNGYVDPYDTQPVTNRQPIDSNSVYSSIDAPPSQGMDLTFNKPPSDTVNNPNNFGAYFNTGLGIADSLIPGERIHKNYPTQPLSTYNPYQYGTGSQAIMEQGGFLGQEGHLTYGRIAQPKQWDWADNGIMLESYDKEMADSGTFIPAAFSGLEKIKKSWFIGDDEEARSGIHIKPENRGKFTAYKKRTGKTTEEALHSKDPHVRQMANFARNAKKWHHAEDGIMLESYDKDMAEDGLMLESYDKITAPNGRKIPGAPIPPPGMQQTGTGLATPQSRGDAYLLDDINRTLATGVRPKTQGYSNPQETQMLNDAYIWRQANNRNSPQANIEGYFNRPVDLNNPQQKYRARLNSIGNGAYNMYNQTPNLDVRQQPPAPGQPVANLKNGGYVEGSVHDLDEAEIAKLLKSGHRIEYLD